MSGITILYQRRGSGERSGYNCFESWTDAPSDADFHFLDPRHSWYGGFDWWHGKLAKVIEQLADEWIVAIPRLVAPTTAAQPKESLGVRTAKCHLRLHKAVSAGVRIVENDQPGFVQLSGATRLQQETSVKLYPNQ